MARPEEITLEQFYSQCVPMCPPHPLRVCGTCKIDPVTSHPRQECKTCGRCICQFEDRNDRYRIEVEAHAGI